MLLQTSEDIQKTSAPGLDETSWTNQMLIDVYSDLRRLAKTLIWKEAPGLTLQPTDLVHDAYLRLAMQATSKEWANRGHYFVAVAEAMRRILIERARRKKTVKHGVEYQRISIAQAEIAAHDGASPEDLLALNEAMLALEQDDQPAAEIAKLRIFTGLTLAEVAKTLNLPQTSVFRSWQYARAFLIDQMNPERLG